jgi:hypothetical protein
MFRAQSLARAAGTSVLLLAGGAGSALAQQAAAEGKRLSCTVASGREERCTSHMRYDGQRRVWPVSITVTVPPAKGKVSTRTVGETAKNGLQVQATEIDYRSNPGFVGQDSFTYQRRSDDPSDPLNGTYTMIVTVK